MKKEVIMSCNTDKGKIEMRIVVDDDSPWYLQGEMFTRFINSQGYNLNTEDLMYNEHNVCERAYESQ